MGKKAELREELEITSAELVAANRRIVELEDKLAISHTALAPMLRPDAPYRTPGRPYDPDADNDLPGTELEPFVDKAAAEDLQAIRELHRPPAQVEKQETALDVVRANNNERTALQRSQKLANALIGRIASALRVDKWDEDGTEILDKVMQLGNFGHWLEKRRKSYPEGLAKAEVTHILAAFHARADLAQWIMTKVFPVPSVVLEATAPAPVTPAAVKPRTVTKEELHWISDQLHSKSGWWIAEALKTEGGTNELLTLINLVLIPYLDGKRSVTGAGRV